MLHLLATTVVLGLTALALDAMLRIAGRPTRWIWAAALIASIVLPAIRLATALSAGPTAAVPTAIAAPIAGAAEVSGSVASWAALLARAEVGVSVDSPWQRLDVPLGAAWLLLTLGVAGWGLAGFIRLRRVRREWVPAEIEGTSVLVSGRTGPALAGLLRPQVVLPEWALASDPAQLRLMLAHEHEHARAGDPWMLAAAAFAVALLPWNPALWWQLRRLRLAVEIDCDGRVLRRHPDVRRYGALLLAVGQQATGPRLPLAALGTPPTTLERRIRTMTMPRPRHPRLLGGALAVSAVALTLVACEMPRPTEVAPVAEIPLASIRSETGFEATERVTVERVRQLVLAEHPEYLENRTGQQRVLYVIMDSRDSLVELRMEEGNRAEKGASLLSVAPDRIASIEVLKLRPGQLLPDSTGVIWLTLKAEGADAAQGTATNPAGTSTIRVLGVKDGESGAISVVGRPIAGTTDSTAASDRRGMAPLRVVSGRPIVSSDSTVIVRRNVGTTARVALSGESISVGSDSTVVFRGSVNADSPPLIMIDGVVGTQATLQALDPTQIESVEVVKGAAAAGIYGERGANGVIAVTTKKKP